MTGIRWKADEHEARWLEILAILEAHGWRARLTCIAAPVQVEGTLPTGQSFYFRARHGEICLAVGGLDPSDVPDWQRCKPHPEASYLSADEGLAILHELADAYTAERNDTSDAAGPTAS